MSYKFEIARIPMPRDKDRRVKLTDQERQEIIDLQGVMGAQKTGKMYGVSKRLVQFIRDPEKLAENIRRKMERGGSSIYYDKIKNTEAMRRHRRYKASVLKETMTKDYPSPCKSSHCHRMDCDDCPHLQRLTEFKQ
jgi:hypothetical protein